METSGHHSTSADEGREHNHAADDESLVRLNVPRTQRMITLESFVLVLQTSNYYGGIQLFFLNGNDLLASKDRPMDRSA